MGGASRSPKIPKGCKMKVEDNRDSDLIRILLINKKRSYRKGIYISKNYRTKDRINRIKASLVDNYNIKFGINMYRQPHEEKW